jgi:hypothetical protein
MHHITTILNQDVPTHILDHLVRVELLCVREHDGTCLANLDDDGVFILRGHTKHHETTLLHVFDDDASEFAELIMALVEDTSLPLSYKDANTEIDFTDTRNFGAWLEQQNNPKTNILLERLQDLL